MCSVSYVMCLPVYVVMCSYTQAGGSQTRMCGVFFHCFLASCLATVYLVELETMFQLVWDRCGALRFYLSPPPNAGVAGTHSYAHL